MNKEQIKEIARYCFDAGKNDYPDSNFNDLFLSATDFVINKKNIPKEWEKEPICITCGLKHPYATVKRTGCNK